jgi:hypothetical protein
VEPRPAAYRAAASAAPTAASWPGCIRRATWPPPPSCLRWRPVDSTQTRTGAPGHWVSVRCAVGFLVAAGAARASGLETAYIENRQGRTCASGQAMVSWAIRDRRPVFPPWPGQLTTHRFRLAVFKGGPRMLLSFTTGTGGGLMEAGRLCKDASWRASCACSLPGPRQLTKRTQRPLRVTTMCPDYDL